MAGTLFGLGLSVQYDASGIIAPGALLYIYEANTSTPVTTYSDFGLTVSQTWPLVADASGRLPQFWVADGSYRALLTTAVGVTIFDEASITAIGASSSGSSSSGASVDQTTVFATGDMLWIPYQGTRDGWVRANGRTIGSSASGATERANSDTSALYSYLWTNFSNSLCAVSGGRGATAAADFSANKTLATLDMRGRGAFGIDDMGNSTAGVIAGGTTIAGNAVGAETVTLTTSNLPSYSLSVASITGSVGTSLTGTNGTTNIARNPSNGSNLTGGGGGNYVQSVSTTALSLADGTVTFGGSIPSGGGGSATNKMPPCRLGTWYIKC